uniref:Chromo domain-containing protein n=1 Tax=Mycena chlorophos TaxID=658473 RepID=A0ABQ0LAL8_MYCCL|nr:predicted protein [Mycena chlorophos]
MWLCQLAAITRISVDLRNALANTTLEAHRQKARDALVLAQERQARAYNKSRRPVERIGVGDMVLVNPHTLELVESKGVGRKLVQRTIGPFEVIEKVNPMVFRIRLPDKFPMHSVLDLDHMSLYRPSDAKWGIRTELPDTRDYLQASEEGVVEAILGHDVRKQRGEYKRFLLVRWEGLGPAEDSWVSEYDMQNAPVLKREYLRMLGLKE